MACILSSLTFWFLVLPHGCRTIRSFLLIIVHWGSPRGQPDHLLLFISTLTANICFTWATVSVEKGELLFHQQSHFFIFLTVVPQVETLWKDVLFLASPLVAMVPFLHSDLFLLSCLLGKLWLSGGSMQTVRGQPWTARLPAESNCY